MADHTEHICEATDDVTLNCLTRILEDEFQATTINVEWGVAGNVEIWWQTLEINGSPVLIEWENWSGVELSGDKAIIEAIVTRLHERMAQR